MILVTRSEKTNAHPRGEGIGPKKSSMNEPREFKVGKPMLVVTTHRWEGEGEEPIPHLGGCVSKGTKRFGRDSVPAL